MTRASRVRSSLAGWRVLLPRTGSWAPRALLLLSERGATVIATDLIAAAAPPDPRAWNEARLKIERGAYDWIMASSSSAAEALAQGDTAIPSTTRIAAVGEATAAALRQHGFVVAFTASAVGSAVGLASEWQRTAGSSAPQRVLALHSDVASTTLRDALGAAGHSVDAAVAYSTATLAPDPGVVAEVRAGGVDAILVTSGSVARAVSRFLSPLPRGVAVVTIGPVTTRECEAAGIEVAATAEDRSVDGLIAALEDFAARGRTWTEAS